MPANTGYTFNIQNSDGTSSSTRVDFGDMFVAKDLWYNAGLWGWGDNQNGQLGNGTTVYYSSPIQVGSLTNWKQVDCGSGSGHMVAVKTDGTLWAWGYNAYGGLGNGTRDSYSSPIQIGSLTNWSQVSSGSDSSAAIKNDGTLWTWGYNNNGGELGNGTTIDYSSPIQIGSLTNWKQVSCNEYTAAAIKTDGTLWTWGYNFYGQLGYEVPVYGTSTISGNFYGSPTWANTDSETAILYTSAGAYTTFAIDKNGGLWGWGVGSQGVLGNGATVNYSSPIQIGSLTNWRQASTGFYTNRGMFTVATKTDNTLWAWGYNIGGVLGNNTTTNYSSPLQVGLLTNWKQVAAGGTGYFVAVKTDGTLWSCGYNSFGQLGNGTNYYTNSYSSPIQIGSLTNWKQVACGYNFCGAVKTDGTLWAWGRGDSGQFGNGTAGQTAYYSSPIQIGSLTNWKQVACGTYDTMAAVKTDGTIWAWGYNGQGQLGNGTTTNYSSPIQIGSLTNWKQVACGRARMSAIKTDGTLWTWGGDGYGSNSSSPVQVGTSTKWTQVNCGYYSTFAYGSDNTLYGSGRNSYGSLGVPTSLLGKVSSPIQIGSLTNWKQVDCGSYYMGAVKTDGTLWAWGYNRYGQLGNGTGVYYSSPIQVGSLTNWKQIAFGYYFTAAIKTDGTLWAWGYNQFGALGNGTTTNYSSPIQVGLLTNWSKISCGFGHTAAVKTDGTLWAWGQNQFGALGNGTRVYYSSPIQIGSLTIWKQVSQGVNYCFAIQAPELELAKYAPGAPTVTATVVNSTAVSLSITVNYNGNDPITSYEVTY